MSNKKRASKFVKTIKGKNKIKGKRKRKSC